MKYRVQLYELLSRHKIALFLSGLCGLALVILGGYNDSLLKTITFLAVMVGCFLLSEFIYQSGGLRFENWKIEQPKKELFVIVGVIIIQFLVLIYWFVIVDQSGVSLTVRIITLVLRFLFIFPVFLLVYFLAVRKYSLRQLGIWRLRYWYVSIPLIVLIGGATYLTFPEGMQFQKELQGNGYLRFITLGFLTAAIPEEIARSLFQTRLGVVLNNKGLAWFIVGLIWALSHVPLFSFQSGDYYSAILSALGIMPIGLLWGYLNERYRSIIPSVLIHGTNLWGLQNIL